MTPNTNSKPNPLFAMVAILVIPLIFIVGRYAPKGWNWFLIMSLMIVFVAFIGKLITRRYSGIFINERNKMSLSRFQLAIWTLIVLSAFSTIALERIYASPSVTDPLAIAIPEQLWYLLGISTASLVGSPLILSTKLDKEPTTAAINEEAKLLVAQKKAKKITLSLKDAEDTINNNVQRFGILASKEDRKDAQFSDIFRGDERGNSDSIDVAKVQKFFFTIIIAFSYMLLLLELIMTAEPTAMASFPALDDGLVALLGISSAGYLTNKTFDKTKTEQKP